MLVAWPIRYKHCNNPYPRQDQWVDEREEELEEAEIEQDIPDDVSESYSMEFVYTMDGGTVVPELDQDELPLFGVEQHQIPLQPGDTSPEFIESKATDNDHASACTYGDSVSWSDQREDQAIDESFTEGTSDSLLRNSTPGSHKSIRLDPAPEDVKEDDQRLHSVDPEKVSEVSEVVSLDTEQQLRKQRLEEEDKAKVLVTEVELEPSGVSESRARHVHADPSMVILEDQIEATTPANIPMVSAKAVQITVPLIKPDGEQKTPTLPTTPSRKLPSQSKMDELKTKSICLLERLQRDCSSEVEKVKSIQACNSMRTRLLLDNSIEQQRDDYEALENIVKIHSEFYVKKLTELFDDFTVDNC